MSGGPGPRRRRVGSVFGIALDPFDEQVEDTAKRLILFDEARLERRDLRLERGEMFGVDRRGERRRRFGRFGCEFEHILCGVGFNYMGELVPYWYRLTNVFKFIQNKELAGELCALHILGSLRYTVRTALHYPQIWPTCVETIQRGMRVGQESDALFMAKMETVFDLPIEEARKRLGVRGAVDVDTHHAGEIWAGRAFA